MYLRNLKIIDGDAIVRNIHFHKGLNLIVDETDISKRQESGNNVGKTTVLRLVDYCLAGKGKSIYQDPEFQDKTNTLVENYLHDADVIIECTFTDDFSDNPEKKIVIERNFKARSNMVIRVNGEDVRKKYFQSILKQEFFDTDVEKPTFRQIIARNIRDEKEKLVNTIKVLHTNVTKEEYEAIYFFWFGIDTDTASRKLKLSDSKKAEQKLLTRLKKERSRPELEQALNIVERDILTLEKKKEVFNLDESYEHDLEEHQRLRNQINKVSTQLNSLKLKRDIITESRGNLSKQLHDIDTNQLLEIYGEAKEKLTNLNKSFDSLVSFHNSMINDRIAFIDHEIPTIDSSIRKLESELSSLVATDRDLSISINKQGALRELEVIIDRLNERHEVKGGIEEQISLIERSEQRLARIQVELDSINDEISSTDTILNQRVAGFNEYFSVISELLYDEQFILVPEKDDRAYKLKITNVLGNPGTGKKKAQAAAFDLAYIQFCQEYDIPCLKFVMHDQVENVHGNQIDQFAEFSNSINAQFILPILSDKLPSTIDIDKYAVVKLSEHNKLLKLEENPY